MKYINSIQKKSILIICPYPKDSAAGQRLKYEQYLKDWENLGYTIKISNFMDNYLWKILYKKGNFFKKIYGIFRGYIRRLRDIFSLGKYDIVYIFMWVTPFGTTFFERLFVLMSKKIIFDLEDNVLLKNTARNKNSPNPLSFLLKNPNKQLFLVAKSNYVITSSPALEDICKKINIYSNAIYITSSVNTEKFRPKSFNENKKCVIGWTGTFSSKEYIQSIEDILQELAKKVDFQLHIIGNFDYKLDNVDLKVSQWNLKEEVKQMQTFDIGIYPLPNNDWVDGKSGLKAIQYLSFGIPTVATNVGNTPNVINHGEEGLLVKTKKEWVSALKKLITDKELRRQMGKKARIKAEEKYSQKIVCDSYVKVLDLCAGKNL